MDSQQTQNKNKNIIRKNTSVNTNTAEHLLPFKGENIKIDKQHTFSMHVDGEVCFFYTFSPKNGALTHFIRQNVWEMCEQCVCAVWGWACVCYVGVGVGGCEAVLLFTLECL